ncbi:MAG: SDR family NAD(P)-dependent oxidoreductase [Magnetococcales bacterium]|nr:SDR family NAD(P)-dependent oxidoreductase [Magnetococcales bacterium]
MSSKVMVYGATSAIAQATARLWAAAGDPLFLVARDGRKLQQVADDLKTRGAARIETRIQDATDLGGHAPLVEEAWQAFKGLDLALVAQGFYPDPRRCLEDPELMRQALEVNTLSVFSLVNALARRFESRGGGGTIVVLGAPAGERGAGDDYVHAASKVAVDVFLEGTRRRLAPAGVQVMTVKPARTASPLRGAVGQGATSPSRVARDIALALLKRQPVCYSPGYRRWWS